MILSDEELEKKVDNLLGNITFSELEMEPPYTATLDFMDYLFKLKEQSENQSSIPGVGSSPDDMFNRLMDNFMNYTKKMDGGFKGRVSRAENLFSKFLVGELNIAEQDVDTISDPFCIFADRENEFFSFLKKYNFQPMMIHKKRGYIPLDQFKMQYDKNQCCKLSCCYGGSMDYLINYWMSDSSFDHQMKIFEKVTTAGGNLSSLFMIEPWKMGDLVKMKEEMESNGRKSLEKHKEKLKSGLVSRVRDINTTYNEIRKKYRSLAEYFEKDMLSAFNFY